ncbi:hypothetical protein ACFQH9_25495 [Pseudonocardia lutea]|uniref:Uncharacterized protein n=1 Tax=Pseudonocardia lutea TaxID=2172015 RepID=A0ABW1IDV6_9PSEU
MSEHAGHERRGDETRGERLMDKLDPRTDSGHADHGDRHTGHDDRSFLDKVLGREPGQHGHEGQDAAPEDRGGVGTRERGHDTGEGGGPMPSPRGHEDHLPEDRGHGDLGAGDVPDDGLRGREGGTGHADVRRDEGVRTVDLDGGQDTGATTATGATADTGAGGGTTATAPMGTHDGGGHDSTGPTGSTATAHGGGVPDERMPGDEGGHGLRERTPAHTDGGHDGGYDRGHDTGGRSRAESMGAPTQETDSSGHATLIPQDRSADYLRRWESLKASFVDEPRGAVRDANGLVGEVLDELEQLFKRQRTELERDLNNESASTEDLRLALGRYRSFFERLLTI